MNDPVYAVHDRMVVRRAGTAEGTWQRQTADLYLHLLGHILQAYPDPGPLRSTALRKLAESLNDALDHDQLVRAHRQRTQYSTYQASSAGA